LKIKHELEVAKTNNRFKIEFYPQGTHAMPTREKDTYCIRSVENALLLLEALADEDSKCSLSQLSQKLGMTKASLFRLMATFESHGYVERGQGSSEYKLGLAAFEVGQKLLSRMTLLHKARPVMRQLVRQCNETVYLAVQRDDDALFLEMADNDQKVKVVSLNGRRFPLTQCAAGKVLLAFDNTTNKQRIEQQPQLQEELATCHELGFSLDRDGLGEGSSCLAVPIFKNEGQPCGCLAVVGPSFRMDEERINQQLLPAIKAAGEMTSARLGHIGFGLKSKELQTATN
jgi:DNA-binding IclR family transcriptional regulator